MKVSLLKRANGPSHSREYRKTVLLKLLAFGLALAIFLPLTALVSRPKQMKDLSEGALPLTFATRDKDLQRELAALSALRALPKQREEAQSPTSKRLCDQISYATSMSDFQELKTACDKFNSDFAAQAQGSFQTLLDFAKAQQEPFELRRALPPLTNAFSQGESSQQPVSLRLLAPDGTPSPLPDIQKILSARFAVQLSEGEELEAAATFSLMLKMANCVLNSSEPDAALLLDTLKLAASSLDSSAWRDQNALRELQLGIQLQRGRPIPQRSLLASEREKALLAFEQVRRSGLRSLDGAAPGSSMLADAVRELKPSSAIQAIKNIWNGASYSSDSDENASLKLLKRLNGPGFMPYFIAEAQLAPQAGDGEMTAKLKASLLNSYRKQSEALALMEAMDAAIRVRLGMELDKTKVSPLTGTAYGILKSQGRAKAVFGKSDAESVKILLQGKP